MWRKIVGLFDGGWPVPAPPRSTLISYFKSWLTGFSYYVSYSFGEYGERELTGQLDEIVGELERQRRVIDQALAALRDVEGMGSIAPQTAASKANTPLVGPVRKVKKEKQLRVSRQRTSTVEKAWSPRPSANAVVQRLGKTSRKKAPVTSAKQARSLAAGTMKARTVELLRKVGKPMRSSEVARRMKIGAGYASVNLSQLRRDGFLNHTAAGYVVR